MNPRRTCLMALYHGRCVFLYLISDVDSLIFV